MKKIIICWSICLCALIVWAQPKEQAVSLTTQDGWQLAGVYLPAQPEHKTALLLHDIGKSHQAFALLIEKMTAQGEGYLALDLRGHGDSINKGSYRSFAKEGVDNEYNQMIRDVNAAVEFLKKKGVAEEEIMFIGAGMGGNVAAKASSLWPGIGGLALITPVVNFRDVLPVPALRVYKGPVFIAAAADDKKTFLEASVMRNVSFLSSGEGIVTFATAYDKKSHELVDTWVWPEIIQWIQTPQKPVLSPDPVEDSGADELYGSYEAIEASGTEEALVPSILQ